MIACAVCKKHHEMINGEWLQVSVEIGWYSSAGGSPEGIAVEGLCGECADKLYNELANVLRRRLGMAEVEMADEPALQDTEEGER